MFHKVVGTYYEKSYTILYTSLINCNIYAILLLILFCIHNIVLAVYSFPTIYDIDTSRNNNVHAIHTASNHGKTLDILMFLE